MDRSNLVLGLFVLAIGPLIYVNLWFGAVACVPLYGLIARLADRDLDRRRRKNTSSKPQLMRRHHGVEESLHA